MGWFRVHSDDLHKVRALDLTQEPIEELEAPQDHRTKVQTKDVQLHVATFRSELMSSFGTPLGSPYISGEVITRTNPRDAFLKGVQELMETKGFVPSASYTVSVSTKTVKEPV